ncbi:MAG: tetratricopeptide repeat protein [Saccharofermentanales bacterium]
MPKKQSKKTSATHSNFKKIRWNRKRIFEFLIFPLIVTIIGGIVLDYFFGVDKKNVVNIDKNLTQLLNRSIDYMDIKEIDKSKASAAYRTGMELYEKRDFKNAAIKFEEALREQGKLTGAYSDEIGIIYCMLGLSRIYYNNYSENGDDAITALTSAQVIFKENENQYMLSKSFLYTAVAYFEMGFSHLNLAKENVEQCIAILNECVPNEIKSMEYTFDSKTVIFPHIDNEKKMSENGELLYRFSQILFINREASNLLGKIHYRQGNPAYAFYNFNSALYFSAVQSSVDYHLAVTTTLDKTIQNFPEDVVEYIQGIDINDILSRSVECKIYQLDSDVGINSFEKFKIYDLPFSSHTATYLSNRAMSEIDLGCLDKAITDCEDALTIWNHLSISDRSNISYTYKYLTVAILMKNVDAINAGRFPDEDKKELLKYLELAVDYDIELYGDSHLRTADSYYNQGLLQSLFGDFETAYDSFQRAKDIYLINGEVQDIKTLEDLLEQLSDSSNEGKVEIKLIEIEER